MFERIPLLIARLRAFVRSADLDRDFEQELDAHVAMLTEDNIRRGMPPAEASRAARMRTGRSSSSIARRVACPDSTR